MVIAVTGRRTGSEALSRPVSPIVARRLVVRDAARAPRLAGATVVVAKGYHDRTAMTEALRGAQTPRSRTWPSKARR
jgi:hypothetical protein